ncbi:MAG TPA: neutral zinc metallopeptidase [Gammaproteobacteria bacterium]|nr:neutral zinc metallopeptidase [Gammaproteobacteria bacterium]
MRWRDLRRSDNVRDVRGEAGGMRTGFRIPLGRGGGLAAVALLLVVYFIGGPDAVEKLLDSGGAGDGGSADAPQVPRRLPLTPADESSSFVSAILGSTEDVWGQVFSLSGRHYVNPELTLFDGVVESACGFATAAVGPFYCPADHVIYLDTSFFADLANLGGPGEFAQAYVIGHEVGHHVQNLLGTSDQVRAAQERGGGTRLQIALELQADCFAGVWAHHANVRQHVLEPGDVEQGLAAAQAIGDDRLQRNAGRRVTPDSFTHGSSSQRSHWLKVGLDTGNPAACDTFR